MKRSTRTLRLYKWSFKERERGKSCLFEVRSFLEKIRAMPRDGSIKVPPNKGLYVFGQPNPLFEGGWRGSSDIESIKWFDYEARIVEVLAGGGHIILALKDQLIG